ncbi:THO complex subunit 1-like [Gigantopelta aegis]|uniref:THO complex subunit 1-like n=1 Tax=Gigantopelta aegis TaxID=1735272 RepID=UPI001B88DB3E|nr:THO complex subunit 1-like [Gigantopelta aegis]
MAAPSDFDFYEGREIFKAAIQKSIADDTTQNCLAFIAKYPGSDPEKKSAMDQALRDLLKWAIVSDQGIEGFKVLINFAIEAGLKDAVSPSTPFVMMSDIFDMLTLKACEDIFSLVEDRVTTWKSPTFYDAGKNYLLRMCNDLIRRLSKSQNTVFCGRIQLFLSRLFPLSEKSALNLMSQFNLENVTVFDTKLEDTRHVKIEDKTIKEENMEVEEGEMDESSSTAPIDYALYRRFWSLQDYFRRPTQCYEKVPWKHFVLNADEVLTAFDSLKLDDLKSQRKKLDKPRQTDTQTFFAKYLTSKKLLDLQLSDSNFRRYVLVQFLILFQYLNSQVKFKTASMVLTDEQSAWLKNVEEKVYQLIRETPPDGTQFAKTIEHILQREENWNSWKNDSCQSYERQTQKDAVKPKAKARRRRIGDDLQASGGKIIKMGSNELTRLWNLNPNNTDACRSDKRIFLPGIEEYFGEAIEQIDPEAQVEDEYKLINQRAFQWKSLRLLARKSPHFFTHSTSPSLPLPKYLENILSKLAKELPNQNSSDDMKTEMEEEDSIKEAQEEEDLKNNEEQNNKDESPEEVLTDDQKLAVAEKLGDDWKKLATELNFPEDEISYLESSEDQPTIPGVRMLSLWQENDTEHATIGALIVALKEIGHEDVVIDIFEDKS